MKLLLILTSFVLNAQFVDIKNIDDLVEDKFILPKSVKYKGKLLSARLEGENLYLVSYEEDLFRGSSRMIKNFIFTQLKLDDGIWKIRSTAPFSYMDRLRHNQIAKISHDKNIVKIFFYKEATISLKNEGGLVVEQEIGDGVRKQISAKEALSLPSEIYEFMLDSIKINGEGPYNLKDIEKQADSKIYKKLFSPQAPPEK